MAARTEMSTTLSKYYDTRKKRTVMVPIRLLVELKPKIAQLTIGKNVTKLKMTPNWFKHDNQNDSLKNIVYPLGTTKNQQHTFDTVARYRAAAKQPNNNFRETSIDASENSTETLIIALDDFVQQFGGELSFTNDDLPFNEAIDHAAYGIPNLGSAHLLAADYIPTAKFSFLIDVDYETDLARSSDTMQNFILNFSNSISKVAGCSNNEVRVISLEKVGKTRKQTKVNFGISTPNLIKTEQIVENLKDRARRGFPNDPILKYVQADDYEYKWMPLISFFQLRLSDFDTKYNQDYDSSMPTELKRGNLPYYLPIGWYRHALHLANKYPGDDVWIGHENNEGEWPVAFHGTHGGAVKGISEQGLQISFTDVKREEAVKQGGEYFDKQGFYVATHCNGGAHPAYTQPFPVPSSKNKTEIFRVVFQCRVKPGAYTIHTSPVEKGEAWRFVDPDAVRPYGILVKREEVSDNKAE